MALYYGVTGMMSWSEWDSDNPTTYRLVLEIEIQYADRCLGIVPDWTYLNETATKFNTSLEQALHGPCGNARCSFVAINWNKDGKQGSGYIPYEFRMLPGSVETCGLRFHKVVMIKGHLYDSMFDHFQNGKAFVGARKVFSSLLRWHKMAMQKLSR
ncbi:unnamed protein product [Symbiodinium pilosum]|uniref:Uncharacterized protein n=1 Tax=Symbiodinium pilosum TaxID=2952 RepID=A0A812M235_SYMPI|nr:unnamed protein product [Symbiodinium pilosum]